MKNQSSPNISNEEKTTASIATQIWKLIIKYSDMLTPLYNDNANITMHNLFVIEHIKYMPCCCCDADDSKHSYVLSTFLRELTLFGIMNIEKYYFCGKCFMKILFFKYVPTIFEMNIRANTLKNYNYGSFVWTNFICQICFREMIYGITLFDHKNRQSVVCEKCHKRKSTLPFAFMVFALNKFVSPDIKCTIMQMLCDVVKNFSWARAL